MTLYSKDEPFIIGIDFDGTITTEPLGGNDFPPPQEGFINFYNFIHKRNIKFLYIHLPITSTYFENKKGGLY